eukprot:1148169-Pelagomonas_calceolata.AAC.12
MQAYRVMGFSTGTKWIGAGGSLAGGTGAAGGLWARSSQCGKAHDYRPSSSGRRAVQAHQLKPMCGIYF